MGTLKPLAGTDLPIQALPKALDSAGGPWHNKECSDLSGAGGEETVSTSSGRGSYGDCNEYLVI